MKCPKCGSDNTRVELVTTNKIERKKNFLYWIFFVWFDVVIWILFFLPRLIIQFLKKDKTTIVSKTEKHLVCDNCGYSVKIK